MRSWFVLLLRRHANAGVSDRELDPVATVGDPARLQPDLAFLGELRAEVLLGVNDETVLVLLGKLFGGADDVVNQGR